MVRIVCRATLYRWGVLVVLRTAMGDIIHVRMALFTTQVSSFEERRSVT
ncbi:MAG: hypothetical protein HW407_1814 [Bacteroidetes bacterium]|nr:hypothetical protein [Bacteroidota bacterium]